MLDEQYKELLNAHEVQPPSGAWEFIDKAINKPWYAKPWGKVALFSSVVVVSLTVVYFIGRQNKAIPTPEITKQITENKTQDVTPDSPKPLLNQTQKEKVSSKENNTNTPVEESNTKSNQVPSSSKEVKGATPGATLGVHEIGKSNPVATPTEKKPNVSNTSGSSTSVAPANNSVISLKLSSNAICIGKVVMVKVSPGNSNAVLDFGDNHRVDLTAGKSLILPYTYALPGIYTVTVRGNNTVLASEEISVDLKVRAFFKTTLTENNSVKFNNLSEASTKFIWFFDDGKQETTMDLSPVVHYYNSTSHAIFNVKLITLNIRTGCSDTFESAVNNPNYKNYFLTIINNVFTPNNDGLNDVFEIPAVELKEWHIIIMDENGSVVFESDKQTNYWNGRVNNLGNECPKGMYRYIIKYMQPDDTEMHQRSGIVTLLR